MIRIEYASTVPALAARRLDNCDATDFFARALESFPSAGSGDWTLHVEPDAIFDRPGVQAVLDQVERYTGPASCLQFELELPRAAWRDYYSLQSEFLPSDTSADRGTFALPMTAKRKSGDGSTETLTVVLNWIETPLRFPSSLTKPTTNVTPTALLMRYRCDHDLLFANQIVVFSELAQALRRSPWSWLRSVFSRLPGRWSQRLPRVHKRVHPSAWVHPTAVIEGSSIGANCRVGAHCVVRYSRLGQGVQLHDGAKVEYSVVDDNSWLMHDLVLYRCHVEPEVFLIHGPYQFSCFQRASAAFATIMMDYRPDGSAIKVLTPAGVKPYAGGFMGALMEEGSKVLGGTLLAPGSTVPRDSTVGPPREHIIRPKAPPEVASRSAGPLASTGR